MSAYSNIILAHPNLVGYWRLGETSGTVAADSSANGLTGAYAGSPTLGVTGLITNDADKAFTSATTPKYMEVPYNAAFAPSTFSVECWINPSTGNDGNYVAKCCNNSGAAGTKGGWQLDFGDTGTAVVFYIFDGDSNNNNMSTGNLGTGTTRHVVITYDGTNQRIYIDGSLSVGPTAGANYLGTTFSALTIGGDPRHTAGAGFAGTVDEFAFYNAALSAPIIAQHYAVGKARTSTNLLSLGT